jgi:hypothetical protein
MVVLFAAGGLALLLALTGVSAQSSSTVPLIGVDPVIQGNTATSVGTRDTCISVNAGQQFPVDIFVDAVPGDRPMIGFQFNLYYDANLLTVVEADNDFLLGAVGQYQPFDGPSDPLPDSDGTYDYSIADLASNLGGPGGNSETGPGVLTRLTLEAKAAGSSDVGLVFEPPHKYPALIDFQNKTMDVVAIAETLVVIGSPCPSDVTPEEQTTVLPPISEIPSGNVETRTLAPDESIPARTSAPESEVTPTDDPQDGETPSPTPECVAGSATPEASATTESASVTPTSDPAASPTESPLPTCAPTARPTESPSPTEASGDGPGSGEGDGGSDTAAIIAAAALGIVGVAAVGSGGWLLFRRRPAGL